MDSDPLEQIVLSAPQIMAVCLLLEEGLSVQINWMLNNQGCLEPDRELEQEPWKEAEESIQDGGPLETAGPYKETNCSGKQEGIGPAVPVTLRKG